VLFFGAFVGAVVKVVCLSVVGEMLAVVNPWEEVDEFEVQSTSLQSWCVVGVVRGGRGVVARPVL